MSERAEMAAAAASPLSLRRNFAWTLGGNGVYAACQWGMLVVLAKLGTPEAVGRFALALAVTAPVFMLANLNLRAVQATDARREYSFGEYLTLRLGTTVLALAAVVLAALVGGFGREASLAVLAVGLAKAFEACSDTAYGLFQQRERMDRIAVSLALRGSIGLAGLALVFAYTGSVAAGASALAVSWAVVLASYDLPSALRLQDPGPRASARIVRLTRLARLAAPLGIVMMLISLNSNIPRYFLERYHGESAVGIYSALAYLLIVGTMVVNALGGAASPRLARLHAKDERAAFGRLLGVLAAFGVALGVAGILVVVVAGAPLLTLLYSAEYSEHADDLAWLMAAAGLAYVASFLGYAMTAARVLRTQAALFSAVAVACAVSCYIWVPRNGVRGAVWAILFAYGVQLAASAAVCAVTIYRRSQAR